MLSKKNVLSFDALRVLLFPAEHWQGRKKTGREGHFSFYLAFAYRIVIIVSVLLFCVDTFGFSGSRPLLKQTRDASPQPKLRQIR